MYPTVIGRVTDGNLKIKDAKAWYGTANQFNPPNLSSGLTNRWNF